VTDWHNPASVVNSTTSYDPLERPLQTTVNAWSAATGDKLLSTTYSYDDLQNKITVTDPNKVVQEQDNDALGQTMISIIYLASQSAGEPNQETSYQFHDARGLLVRTQDAVGNWQDYTYDNLGRTTAQTVYATTGDSNTALTTVTNYLDQAHPVITKIGPAPNNVTQDTLVDEMGRTYATHSYPRGTSDPAITVYSHDGRGNLLAQIDANNNLTNYSYDTTGWLLGMHQHATVQGHFQDLYTQYGYDLGGNRISVTDANHNTSTTQYDVLNRPIAYTDALTKTWRTAYDGLNRTVSTIDATGNVNTYSYDDASRLLQLQSTPLGGSSPLITSYSYANATSNPSQMTDSGLANPTNYSYDGLNRLINVTSAQGLVNYHYDSLNRRASIDFGPSQQTLSNHVDYTYDGLSRPKTISNNFLSQIPTGHVTQVLQYSYSGERLNQLDYPDNTVAVYAYDGADRTTDLDNLNTSTGRSFFNGHYTLNKMGNLLRSHEDSASASNISPPDQHRDFGNNYDELNRLIVSNQRITSLNGQSISHYDYGYDAVGNRLSSDIDVTASNANGSNPSTSSTTSSYSYDVANHLKTEADSNITYANSHKTTTQTNSTYSYDNNGNLQLTVVNGGDLTTTYSYDGRNRLSGTTQVPGNGKGGTTQTVNYTYDGANNRISLNQNGNQVNYLQDVATGGLSVVLQQGTPGYIYSYLYQPGSTVPLFHTDASPGIGYWNHLDIFGSVRAESVYNVLVGAA
jgi:YD repeat-containing protein